jgi:hypothetical protein
MKCEFLTLADAAQVQGDRILILGRGVRCLSTGEGFPFRHSLGVAASLLMGGLETNQPHHYTFRLSPEDPAGEAIDIEGDFEKVRPANTPPDDDQHMLLAANFDPRFRSAGPYVVQVLVDGEELARTSLTVLDSAPVAAS